MKIFIPLARNCTRNASDVGCHATAMHGPPKIARSLDHLQKICCYGWSPRTKYVLIRDGFGACFDVPEVVQAILHFGNTVAVLILVKNVLLLFVRKIHEVTPTHFFDITAFFISYLPNG